jgi:DNA modification methylase
MIASIDDIDEQCDGLLIHSENFQVLNMFQERFREQVKCVYIDPPYNTGKDEFPYKDSYQHSSWLAMINERIARALPFMKKSGAFFVSIDEKEHHNLRIVSDSLMGTSNLLADFVWVAEGNFDNQAKIKMAHEYILGYAKNESDFDHPPIVDPSTAERSKLFRDEIRNTIVKNGPKNPVSDIEIPAGFPASFKSGVVKSGDLIWPKYNEDIIVENYCVQNIVIAASGWSSKALYETFVRNGMTPVPDTKGQMTTFVLTNTGAIESVKKRSEKQSYVTSIIKGVGTIQSTSSMLNNMGCSYPHYPKPPRLVSYLISMTGNEGQLVFDYFAGSGTTGQAVIDLNREDGGNRKFILVEMGTYFDTVTKPRIQKVIYSKDWKNGKPVIAARQSRGLPRVLHAEIHARRRIQRQPDPAQHR